MRKCTSCGRRYLRRNLIEAWTTRNEGHRDGWHKDVVKLCMDCQSKKASERVMLVASVRVVPHHAEKKRHSR